MGGSHPSVDLALVVLHHGRDVILDHLGQGLLVADGLDPGRELRVPDYMQQLQLAFDFFFVVFFPYTNPECGRGRACRSPSRTPSAFR